MYSIKELLNRNPVQISAAVIALVNALIIFGVLPEMTPEEVSALNLAITALLGLFVVSKTTNTAKLNDLE